LPSSSTKTERSFFINQTDENPGFRYVGSSVNWHLLGDVLSVKLVRRIYWRDAPTKSNAPARTFDFGANNEWRYAAIESEWQVLGNLTEYRKAYHQYLADKTLPEPTAEFFSINGGQVSSPTEFYFARPLTRLGFEERIVQNLKQAVQGSAGDWSPEKTGN
jgi:hypothetical protein